MVGPSQGFVIRLRVLPARYPVVGTGISATSYEEVVGLLSRPDPDKATVIAVCNVHSVMESRRQEALRRALDEADLATPDGMPLVWALRRMFNPVQKRVYGPEIMRRALSTGLGLRHYLYGGSEEALRLLEKELAESYKSAAVVGSKSPPFRNLTEEELADHVADIRASGANVVWVGLGMPKQELWMHRMTRKLPGMTLVGVGAAFDFLSGTVPQAPIWMQRAGVEWLFRLIQEPRRLWRRYLMNNPAFLLLLGRQITSMGWRRVVGRG